MVRPGSGHGNRLEWSEKAKQKEFGAQSKERRAKRKYNLPVPFTENSLEPKSVESFTWLDRVPPRQGLKLSLRTPKTDLEKELAAAFSDPT